MTALMTAELGGRTLGERHRDYNRYVQQAISQNVNDSEIADNNIKQLIAIDVAAHKQDLQYILKVLQSENLLFVSRALKKCKWLFTDDKYADIINPEYLKNQLFPLLTMKARTLLMKSVRKHLKDEARAELFFQSEDSKEKALKWLPKCSVSFIEQIVKQNEYYYKISPDLFKKLCERSISVLQVAINVEYLPRNKIDAVAFIRKSNIGLYFDAVNKAPAYITVQFDRKTTNLIMKNFRETIIENFDKYVRSVHIPTFAKYLKKEEVKSLLYKQASLSAAQHYSYYGRTLFTYDNLKYIINVLPEDERFDFVQKVFIDKVHRSHEDLSIDPDSELVKMKKLQEAYVGNEYEWYQMAPFNIAFDELQKLIAASILKNKYSLLTILIKCAHRNQQHLKTVLKYYKDKHISDSNNLKISFIKELLQYSNFSKYDNETWNILDELYRSAGVYSNSECVEPKDFIESIVISKLIRNQEIPPIILKKFAINSLKKYQIGLKNDEKSRIFNYIYNLTLDKIPNLNSIKNEEELKLAVCLTTEVLKLLNDWNKLIVDYPVVIDTIKGLIKLKTTNSWKADLSSLYDVNKSWRKYIFEESLNLKQSEAVAINALKHDTGLLERHSNKIEIMCLENKKISLKLLLRKIRLYWPQSIAKLWLDKYFMRFEDVSSVNSVITRGLFTLMPSDQIIELINKYAPNTEKIDWDNIDAHKLSLQKYIAKNMHLARPQVPPEAILSYAKGDYLQYAIPSVLAMFHNLNLSCSRQHLPTLLNSPVSLQKHGIRLAVTNLEHDDLTKIFYDCWTKSKNATIRLTLFKLTYKMLCKETSDKKVDELWELLKMFIGVLTFEEDKKIYELMSNVSEIPSRVKASYIETNYNFIDSYLPHSGNEKGNYEWRMNDLLEASKGVMEFMNEEFLTNIINKYFETVIKKEESSLFQEGRMLSIASIFLLCAKDENTQNRKYNNVLLPLLKRFSEVQNLNSFLNNLSANLNYVAEKDMVIPVKMFSNIDDELLKTLNVFEHYALLKRWKITLEWAKMIQKSSLNGRKYPEDWKQENAEEPLELGKKVVEILKSDAIDNFSCIYLIYDKLLYNTFNCVIESSIEMKLYKAMLLDRDFIPVYLAIARQASYSKHKNWEDTLQIIKSHPSLEVKLHCDYFSKTHC